MTAEQQQKIDELLKSENNAVVATNSEQESPQSATVSFYANDANELIFGTWKWTRKYKNLQINPAISFVIGFESGKNVQYEGRATQINADDLDIQAYLKKKPSAIKKLDDSEWVWYKVTPNWLRYTDFTTEPIEKFEINF